MREQEIFDLLVLKWPTESPDGKLIEHPEIKERTHEIRENITGNGN